LYWFKIRPFCLLFFRTIFGGAYIHKSVTIQGDFWIGHHAKVLISGKPKFEYTTPEHINMYAGGSVYGSHINIRPGARVIVDQYATLESSCPSMWGGIILDIPTSGNERSSATMDQAYIRDAYKAISTSSETSGDLQFAPLVDVQHSHFINCYYGFDICAPWAENSYLVGNEFVSSAFEMKQPFDFLRNKQFVRTGKTTTDGYFVAHMGIRFNEPFSLPQSHFTDNTFRNMAFGIFCDFDGNPSSVVSEISGNNFTDCHLASIYYSGCSGSKIDQNIITLPASRSLMSSYQMDYTGEHVLGNQAYAVSYLTSAYSYGLFLADKCNSGFSHLITENEISSQANAPLHVGIRYSGMAPNSIDYKENPKIQGLGQGLWHEQESGVSDVNITANKFIDNRISIALRNSDLEGGSSVLNFTLKCNEFVNSNQAGSNPITRKGLVIGEAVQVRAPNGTTFDANSIGGENQPNSGNAYPNANVWPTLSNRTTFPTFNSLPVNVNDPDHGWDDSPDWVSITNHANNATVKYYRFSNEFVGRGSDVVVGTSLNLSATNQLVVTGDYTTLPANSVKACSNFTDPQIHLFPARIAVVGDSVLVVGKGSEIFDLANLEDAVPNPSVQESKIGIYLPAKTQQALLQIIELGTGKILQSIHIEDKGKLVVYLDVSKAQSGNYGYRLLVDGQPGQTKKLVVQH